MADKRVAYLVMEDMGTYVTDFHIANTAMRDLGWEVSTVPWRSSPDWNRYDAVYICTPWDYPQFADEFMCVLEAIDARNPRAIFLDKVFIEPSGLIAAETFTKRLKELNTPVFAAAYVLDMPMAAKKPLSGCSEGHRAIYCEFEKIHSIPEKPAKGIRFVTGM